MTYEFNEEDNLVFEQLSLRLIVQAILLFIGGMVGLVIAVYTVDEVKGWVTALLVMESFLQLGIGYVFIRPSDNLKNISTTSGHDINELMTGLNELNVAFVATALMLSLIMISQVVQLMGGS